MAVNSALNVVIKVVVANIPGANMDDKRFSTIDVYFNHISPEQWVLISKLFSKRIFSEASATHFENATPETLRECLVLAFMNEIVVKILTDEVAKKDLEI